MRRDDVAPGRLQRVLLQPELLRQCRPVLSELPVQQRQRRQLRRHLDVSLRHEVALLAIAVSVTLACRRRPTHVSAAQASVASAPSHARGGPFACDAGVCVQRHVRLPDDGIWECIEQDGVAVCHGGSESAGVVPGSRDDAWRCGARRGVVGERVCVDESGDVPEPTTATWLCEYEHDPDERRVCRRGAGESRRASERGTVPSCWLDGDCGPGQRCRQGICAS